jgi:DNA-binding response OmpR family regulator
VTKLLIVDDEEFTVDMLQTFLQMNGFETFGAFNGEDGLVLVKVEQPEVIILDLMLPDIEGYEVCKRIRTYPDSATLPVVILSARAEQSSKERAMAAGADAYLVKPVQFPVLLSEVNRLLTEKKAQLAAPPPPPAPPTEVPVAPKESISMPAESASVPVSEQPSVVPDSTPVELPATPPIPTTPPVDPAVSPPQFGG